MTPEPKFLRRFEQVRSTLRFDQARSGLAATILAAATCLGFLAWSDFYHELSRPTRSILLVLALSVVLYVLIRRLIQPLRWWTQPRTAIEIESRFPELGQRIRTVTQFAGQSTDRMVDEGVRPSLVEALEVETEERAAPLPLNQVVRRRRFVTLATLGAIPTVLLAVAAMRSGEWRTAIARSVLIERAYTTVEVRPGTVRVDQGANVPIAVEIIGRPRKSVVLQTRSLAQAAGPWASEKIEGSASRRETRVEKIKEPVEYRVVVGPASSPNFEIQIRYPLAIKSLQVQVTPPEYTGLEPRTTRGGDVQAVEGSKATIRIAFDAAPDSASLELTDLARKSKPGEPAPGSTVLQLRRDGDALVADLDLTHDLDYQVVARTVDGRILPKNKYRIDVREDRAPRVVFDEPAEALEVHTLAEVRHRARVDDDFGLTRAGIVFRFNDGEEKTLVLREFSTPTGKKPKTSATLEEMLLIETLNATPLDSVTYYAFAEDNFPGNPRRTETDLRYIDFRAFKRDYKLAEPGSGDGDPLDLIALDELIARQRVNLNRANRFAKHKATDRVAAEDPLKLAGAEEALLNLTKAFTEGIEALADARVDALHKALDAMQASIDALDRGRNAEVPPAMAEALKNLVAARRELLFLIGATSPEMAAMMRQFDRKQAQKIRKPKSEDQEAEEIADRLKELAKEEDFVYATLAGDKGGTEPTETVAEPDPKATNPKEPTKQEGATGSGEPKKAAPGPDAPKGQVGGDQPKGEDGDNRSGDSKMNDRREIADKQQAIADEVRGIEEKLKGLEAVSDLAKARLAKAAETVEKASGDLNRGNRDDAVKDTKAGAGMLHEVARQVKGEIAREAADELAMARDLADELARREADLANQADRRAPPARGTGSEPGQEPKPGQGREPKPGEGQGKGEEKPTDPPQSEGSGEKPGEGSSEPGGGTRPGEKAGPGADPGTKPGQGARGEGGSWAGLTEAEQIDRMAEMAKTLEAWLKQIDTQGKGKAADAVGEILDKAHVAEIIERTARMGEVRVDRPGELGKEARELAARFEVLAEALELLHRGIVAPELAKLAEFDRRLAELTDQIGTLKTDAEVREWRGQVASLVRDLEKAGIDGADALADALRTGGGWHLDGGRNVMVAPEPVLTSLRVVTVQIKDRVQEMILKDLASARDEATPPNYRELVDRYYEVLSRGTKSK